MWTPVFCLFTTKPVVTFKTMAQLVKQKRAPRPRRAYPYIDPLDPEGLVIVVVDNVGRVDVDLVRFGLVQTNGRLGCTERQSETTLKRNGTDGGDRGRLTVAPATDEDFDHGRVDGIAAEQGDVGVVFALDVEGDLLPALGLAADATQVVVAVVVVRVDIGCKIWTTDTENTSMSKAIFFKGTLFAKMNDQRNQRFKQCAE